MGIYPDGGSFDVSKGLPLRARIGQKGVAITLVFKRPNGTSYPITGRQFEVPVYRNDGDPVPVFKLTIGSGLTITGVDGNKLKLEPTQAQMLQRPESHFWLLYDAENDYSLLNGPFDFYTGLTEYTFMDEVVITIDSGSDINTSGLAHIMVPYDASTNLFPDAPLGSGTAGALARGDMFPVSVSGNLLDQDEAAQFVPANSILMLLGDPDDEDFDPQLGASWRILS